ncbi:MAG TPA: alanine racemase, partial [Nitrospirota bacterium]|nr:alanine racemase [Nitrospirota bacterium]
MIGRNRQSTIDNASTPSPQRSFPGRPTAAVVDLGAIEHNFREVTRRAGGRKVLAVVKAQAYGH